MRDEKPQSLTASQLRRLLSMRGRMRSHQFPHEVSFGSVPSFIFREHEGDHGNFHSASYQAIQAADDWGARLRKRYTGGQWIPRRNDRVRCELDCGNSSDALLMNIFCYPGLCDRPELCRLLGIEKGSRPAFGFKPRIPMANSLGDQTEIDMSLGRLMVEAKLTESGFQSVCQNRLQRYSGLDEIFDIAELPILEGKVHSYQLIRGVLAAHHLNRPFLVLIDGRRLDLRERWFAIMRAVRHCELRSQLALLTWQELCSVLPAPLQVFLKLKYAIVSAR